MNALKRPTFPKLLTDSLYLPLLFAISALALGGCMRGTSISIVPQPTSIKITAGPNSVFYWGTEFCVSSVETSTVVPGSPYSPGKRLGGYYRTPVSEGNKCFSTVIVSRADLFGGTPINPSAEYRISASGPGFMGSKIFNGSDDLL